MSPANRLAITILLRISNRRHTTDSCNSRNSADLPISTHRSRSQATKNHSFEWLVVDGIASLWLGYFLDGQLIVSAVGDFCEAFPPGAGLGADG